ncbi:MAG: C25 family cysteine peptidase, partial [Bacteroidia bacterium]|nr:C25 family cysteine peptidase [Bacteroidia bacterium]
NVKALIPNGPGQKRCFLTNTSNISQVTSLAPVNQNGYFVDYKSSPIDSAYLIVSHKGLQPSANDYKAYRQSIDGGSHQVILAYIDELYDQFAYGNKKNPLAIKNFCSFLSDSLPTPPKYLLLLGKSIKNDQLKTNSTNWNACDLPTMGIPSSDNLLTAGIKGSHSSAPYIPVGRISAKTNTQAGYYLDKVKSHELGLKKPEPDDWHKRVLHFAGGTDLNQQQLFQSYLQSYSVTICDKLYGGTVFNFKKTTTAPIQITISDSVKRLIDYGASIITFFGHGSISGFDQAIDDPNAYNNRDKYPLFIANSCYSGDIHTLGANSASENFTLIREKGSIGFIASSSSGIVY